MENNNKRGYFVGQRVYCWNFEHWGTITAVSADHVDTIIDYTDDAGEKHRVYAYMLSDGPEE
jgi:hypothetical protein